MEGRDATRENGREGTYADIVNVLEFAKKVDALQKEFGMLISVDGGIGFVRGSAKPIARANTGLRTAVLMLERFADKMIDEIECSPDFPSDHYNVNTD